MDFPTVFSFVGDSGNEPYCAKEPGPYVLNPYSHHSGESYSANRERIRHYHSWVHELAKELN